MKTRLKLFSLMMLCATMAFSQITFDFSKKSEFDVSEFKNSIKPIQHGDFAILKIDNINTYRYQVFIEGRNIDYATPVPSELQTLFRLPKEEVTSSAQKAKVGAGDIDAANENMKDLEAQAGGFFPSGTPEVLAFKKVMKDLAEACEAYSKLASKMADVKFTRMVLINYSKQKWNKQREMEAKLPRLLNENRLREDYLEFVSYYTSVEHLYAEAERLAENLSKETEEVEEKNDKGKKVKKMVPTNEAKLAKTALERIKAAESSIDEGYHKINEDDFLTYIDDVITLQEGLRNKSNFEASSPPIQMDGDYVEIKVAIVPLEVNDLQPIEQAFEFKIEIPGKGGWKADFSVGPTLSFTKGALDHSFFLQRNNLKDSNEVIMGLDSAGTLKQREVNDAVRPGIAAMIHAYKRSGRDVNWGWMLGVGAGFTSIDNANFSLYTGPSLILGKRQKFMFSGGVSFHRVERLNEAYKLDNTYRVADFDEGVTTKVLKPSIFLSLSYAIGSRIEIN